MEPCYEAVEDSSGDDHFTYAISDGRGGTDTGAVTVTVSHTATTCAISAVGTFELEADLDDCSGDGLVVDRKNTTIHLNGHTISGMGTEGTAGIRLIEHGSVKIIGPGVVEGFDIGALLSRSPDVELSGVTLRDNGDGVVVSGNRALIVTNVVSNNQENGIVQLSGKDVKILSNDAGGNGADGILVHSAARNANVKSNTASNNDEDGIDVQVNARQRSVAISRNSADDNGAFGIRAVAGRSLKASGNTAEGNNGGGPQCDPTTVCNA